MGNVLEHESSGSIEDADVIEDDLKWLAVSKNNLKLYRLCGASIGWLAVLTDRTRLRVQHAFAERELLFALAGK